MNIDHVRKINDTAVECNAVAVLKGWWESNRSDGESVVLMHSELSEALESMRNGDPQDEHCPEFSNTEIELADCIIRIFDYCGQHSLNIGEAIEAKMAYNINRPHKHGKEF